MHQLLLLLMQAFITSSDKNNDTLVNDFFDLFKTQTRTKSPKFRHKSMEGQQIEDDPEEILRIIGEGTRNERLGAESNKELRIFYTENG